jgi:hypothetical protein
MFWLHASHALEQKACFSEHVLQISPLPIARAHPLGQCRV